MRKPWGSSLISFTLTRSGGSGRTTTVAWHAIGGSATAGDFSYGVLPSGQVNFAVGEAEKTIFVSVAGDAAVEEDESFSIGLLSIDDKTLINGSAAVGVIINDDVSNRISIIAPVRSVIEGNSVVPASFTVLRAGDVSRTATVQWQLDTTLGVDAGDLLMGQALSGVVSFAPGEASKNLTVDVAGDTAYEADEILTVMLSNARGFGTALGTATAALLVENDDSAPELAIRPVDRASVSEGQSLYQVLLFEIVRSGNMSGRVTALWGVVGGSANATDFYGGTVPSGTVSFAPGEASKTIAIKIAGDTRVEADESFVVGLFDLQGGRLCEGESSVIATIISDDAAPTFSITKIEVSGASGDRESSSQNFSIVRSGNWTTACSVAWRVSEGSANADDFTGNRLPSGEANFSAGETRATISISIADDQLFETDETFFIDLLNPSIGTLVSATQGRIEALIYNDDPGSSFRVLANDAAKLEGQDGSVIQTFLVERLGDVRGVASVSWAALAGSASADDFVGDVLPSGTVTFADQQALASFTVSIRSDLLAEFNESYTIFLDSPVGGVVSIDQGQCLATIIDDDLTHSEPATSYPVHLTSNAGIIQKGYLAFFNRPADPQGFNGWDDSINANTANVSQFMEVFASSSEYLEMYAGLSPPALINAIYKNLFARGAEKAGLDYWVDLLDRGEVSIGSAAYRILSGAQNEDGLVVSHRMAAAQLLTNALDDTSKLAIYNGVAAAAKARSWLATVTSDDDSVIEAGRHVPDLLLTLGCSGTRLEDAVTLDHVSRTENILSFNALQTYKRVTVAGFFGDLIDLSDFDFVGDQASAVVKSSMLAADAGFSLDFFAGKGVAIADIGSTTYIYVDSNKDGSYTSGTDFEINLVGAHTTEAVLIF